MRTNKVQTILLAVLVLGMSTALCAQVSFNPAYAKCTMHRVSIGVDALYYYGDVCPVLDHPMSIPPRAENIGVGINLNHIYQVIPQLGLRTTLSGGMLRGEANEQSYSYWISKGKTPKAGSETEDKYSIGGFKSFFGEVDFGFEWYPIPNREGGWYIYAGVGVHVGGVYCDFVNPAHNPTGTQEPAWRASILPVGIGEMGYSFRLADGHTLSIKGSLHNGLINVNSKNNKVGYNIDGWGRGATNKADFEYTEKNAQYSNSGRSVWGQFTDGYFTFGIAYTFNAGGGSANRLSAYSSGSSRHHKSFSARVDPRNARADAYKKKVAKARNKAFMVKAKRRK